jgi:hypothetical protein
LQRNLSEVEGFNGFANRFLWVFARRTKLLPDGGKSLDLVAFESRLLAAIEFGTSAGQMSRDEEATERWHEIYHVLARRAHFGLLASIVARAEAQMLRLSMIFALLDKSTLVRKEHLDAAYSLWQYCEDSARFIFGNSTGDGTTDKVLSAIREQEQTMRDLHSKLGNHCSASRLRSILQQLASKGLIRCRKEPSGGRPIEIWQAV